jgi:hypothetical protein
MMRGRTLVRVLLWRAGSIEWKLVGKHYSPTSERSTFDVSHFSDW